MAKFISDSDMEKLEQVSAPSAPQKGFISDADMQAMEGTNHPSTLEALSRGAAKGVTLGFDDELGGGLEAAWDKLTGSSTPLLDLYVKHRNERRAQDERAAKAHPWAHGIGNVVGSVPTFLAGGLIPGVAKLGLAGRAALEAGAMGAGDSTADLTSGKLGEVGRLASDVGKSAVVGAGTASLMSAAAPWLSKKANELAVTSLGPRLKQMKRMVGNDKVQEMGQMLNDEGIPGFLQSAEGTYNKLADRTDEIGQEIAETIAANADTPVIDPRGLAQAVKNEVNPVLANIPEGGKTIDRLGSYLDNELSMKGTPISDPVQLGSDFGTGRVAVTRAPVELPHAPSRGSVVTGGIDDYVAPKVDPTYSSPDPRGAVVTHGAGDPLYHSSHAPTVVDPVYGVPNSGNPTVVTNGALDLDPLLNPNAASGGAARYSSGPAAPPAPVTPPSGMTVMPGQAAPPPFPTARPNTVVGSGEVPMFDPVYNPAPAPQMGPGSMSTTSSGAFDSRQRVLNLQDAWDLRKGIDQAIDFQKAVPDMPGFQQGLVTTRNKLQEGIRGAIPEEGQKLFNQYHVLESAENMAKDMTARNAANRTVSPSDYITGAAGLVSHGPEGAALGIANHVLRTRGASTGAWSLNNLSKILSENPAAFGPFATPLIQAAKRGTQALAVTHFLLSQDQEGYRKVLEGIPHE